MGFVLVDKHQGIEQVLGMGDEKKISEEHTFNSQSYIC